MKAVHFKLFLMMVLEFFIWGAWLPFIFSYLPGLGFTAWQQSLILNCFPLAAVIGMFFSNQFADRNFAAEKFLGFSQLIAGAAMIGLAFTGNFWIFLALMLVHCLLYVPTLSVTNSIAFAHLKDTRDFGLIRMGGTVGWILAAWPFTFILVDWDKVSAAHPVGMIDWLETVLGAGLSGAALQRAARWTFVVAGIASLVLAVFSLTLPPTPPKKAERAQDKLAWIEALRLLRRPFVLVLWIVAFVDAFLINAYFYWAATFLGSPQVGIKGNWIMPIMSIGQIAEILAMAMLAATLKKLGWRATMTLGILAHAVRFAVFSFFPHCTTLIVLVFILHGICYAFFFATVYIFVDEFFPKDARASAQGLFNVMILGLGVVACNTICPFLTKKFMVGDVVDFQTLFLILCGVALAAAITLALFFHPPKLKATLPVHASS
ncbi:MAG: MFS transporter [Limisphaerales bacterium]